ncbi:GDSL esterase/lipase At5g55050-like [Argentina anserina]|uniref:GDSL esterase/lipase At5g55050-like n=1 Tax=Argentina anserina TaxID=57926 RepID=UPI0021765A65|nr:GDSL esterase/lipase At5g55050-like [Potentilla anserina]
MAMEACRVSPTSFFTIFSIIVSVFLALSNAQTVPAIYIFGDSLLDVGNNNYLTISTAKANFPHNGIDFPTKKATGRFCNGKNAADFLAEKVRLATSPPYLSLVSKSNKQKGSFEAGVSFASGGAGIFNGTDDEYRQSLPLTKQIGYYAQVCTELQQQLGAQAAQAHLAKSLHVILIGSNDVFGYLDSSSTQKQYTPHQYVELMLSTLKQHLQRIHSLGARKFVILGTGPVGCCPARRKEKTGECNELGNSISAKYSDGLKSMMQQLKPALGINYSFFETYGIFRNIIQNPSSYGFNETQAACCGLGYLNAKFPCLPVASYCSNRRDHMFWDLYHPTEATHKILVEHLFEGSTYSTPMNVKKLVSL